MPLHRAICGMPSLDLFTFNGKSENHISDISGDAYLKEIQLKKAWTLNRIQSWKLSKVFRGVKFTKKC